MKGKSHVRLAFRSLFSVVLSKGRLVVNNRLRTVMQNRIIENYCSGVYLSPDQVVQLLKDMEQDPKVLEDLERLWSNGQIAVLKKALSAATKSGAGLLEATEVVEPNPISPNESTSYSNLYHCDRDGVYLYIDAVSGQLADAIGKNEGRT